jgi:phage I-like protein
MVTLSEELTADVKKTLKMSEGDKLEPSAAIKVLLSKVVEVETLTAKLSEAEVELNSLKADKICDVLLSEGRMLPAEKEVFAEMYAKDKGLFDKMVQNRKNLKTPLIQLGETGVVAGDVDGDKEAKMKAEVDRQADAVRKEFPGVIKS